VTSIEAIARRTAGEIALAYRNGEADPVAVTDYFLERIEDAGDDRVFITVMPERARKEARAAAERFRSNRPLSPLDGVPIAWKDLFDTRGAPTTAGSVLYRDAPAKEADAACVANAAAAGMVMLGKLNMTEFAYSGLGLNPHFGTPVNPNDRKTARAPGGSSSGSGTSVAGGLTPCAIGTDTGGSVRIPAALNGVVGLKTSEGRIDKRGMVPLSRTLDTVGPLARSVGDCIMLDMVLRGATVPEPVRADLAGAVFVAATNIVLDEAEPAVLDNYEAAIGRLEQAGAKVERRHVEALDLASDMTARHGSLTAAEAYNAHHDLVDGPEGSRIDRRVVHRILQGKAMSAHDILSLQSLRAAAIARLAEELGDALLLMPTTATTAPEVAPLDADDAYFHKINLRTLRNTMLGNMLRLCGIALPTGRDGNGLPTSLLVSGLWGHDVHVMSAGLEIERLLADDFEPTWARG
jgi:aspartyl-tRNA(Asn)/glutamyl-tRNA(Gln) amidotransferase subunit A